MNIKTNSKDVKKNDIFICIHDEVDDRHKYIKDIKDASLIIVDKDIAYKPSIPILKVKNTNDALFDIYNRYYDFPLDNLNLFGITGTDGKTTTAYIINNLLNMFSSSAYLGTLGFYYNKKQLDTKNTTVDITDFLKYASILKKHHIENLVMEVSSEGLLHNRCNNLKFKRALITNITGDHLNVHKDFNNYLNTKLKIANLLDNDKTIIINIDDISYEKIKNKNLNMITYGFKKGADFWVTNYKLYSNKTVFTFVHNNKSYKVESPLLGKFNIYNLLASISLLNSIDIPIKEVLQKIKYLKPVPGRLNVFKTKNGSNIILDYAHTINATKEILIFANNVKKRNIITVVGCAGGRDKSKRTDIGNIVTNYSDKVIFTMDDPRYEKVKDIVRDMIKNANKNNYIYIKNRKKAIKKAIKLSKKDDIVLIIGKGIDNYMAIKNKYKKYNDLKVIKKYI